jgi:transcriptional regulator with XRE-family HTH domain
MNIARAIRSMRLARGISQAEVAARASISPSYLSLLESGKKEPSLAMLRSIAKALRIPDDLLLVSAVDYEQLRRSSADNLALLADQLLALLVPDEQLSEQKVRKR